MTDTNAREAAAARVAALAFQRTPEGAYVANARLGGEADQFHVRIVRAIDGGPGWVSTVTTWGQPFAMMRFGTLAAAQQDARTSYAVVAEAAR